MIKAPHTGKQNTTRCVGSKLRFQRLNFIFYSFTLDIETVG